MTKTRCEWSQGSEIYREYHDNEWGVPVHDDSLLFEFLTLEGAQAGLSWLTVLKRREDYRKAFANFDIAKVAKFSDAQIETLFKNSEIIRNKQKILATVANAKAIMELKKQYGSFDKYIWKFVEYQPVQHDVTSVDQLKPFDDTALMMTKELKKLNFSFVGPTICYSFMQAVGMVNDHARACYRHQQLS